MENINIFEFKNYKDYFKKLVGPKEKRSGIRAKMSKGLKCQSTYISQVLYGDYHFSLEQGHILAQEFKLNEDEKKFLLLLIQKARAGTIQLIQFFQDEMNEVINKQLILTERLGKKTALNEVQQSIYYSSWQFAAVHIALTIPKLQTVQELSNYLNIKPKKLSDILHFLCSVSLAKKVENKFCVGDVHIRLGNTSSNIAKHHTNWRLQAIESFEKELLLDMHYSGVVSLSESDVVKLKNDTLKFIQESLELIKNSPEERLYCLNLDLFEIKKI